MRTPAGPKIHRSTSCGMLPGTSIVPTCCVEEPLPLGQREDHPGHLPKTSLRSAENVCSAGIRFSITWIFFS